MMLGHQTLVFLPFSAFSLWVVLEVKRQVFVKLPWGGSLALLADIKAWLATIIINCDKKNNTCNNIFYYINTK